MQVKLANRFLIICSASLLMLLPAYGGAQSPQTETYLISQAEEDESEGEDTLKNVANNFKETFYQDFKEQIKKINFEEKSQKFTKVEDSIEQLEEFEQSIIQLETQLNSNQQITPILSKNLSQIKDLNNVISSILEDLKTNNTEQNNTEQLIQKLSLEKLYSEDNLQDKYSAITLIIQDYLIQRIERIQPRVDFITDIINLELDDQTTSNDGDLGSNTELAEFLDKYKFDLLIYAILLTLILLILVIVIVINIRAKKQLKREIEELKARIDQGNRDNGGKDLRKELVSPIEQSLAPLSVLDNPNLAEFLNSLSTIKKSLHKLEKLDKLDSLDLLKNLECLSQMPILIESVQSLKDSQQHPNYLEVFSNINDFLKQISTRVEHLEQIYSPQSTSVKSSHSTVQKTRSSIERSAVAPNPTKLFSQPSFLGSETEGETTEPTVEPKSPPASSDYDLIPLPQDLINRYQQEAYALEKKSRKVKQSFGQIQKQLGGDPNLIFELETEGYTPYWIFPCADRIADSTDEHLYWLFLAREQQISESNIPTLGRYFLGKIDRSWIGKKWKLVEPALLKTIQGTTQFQLVKQGRLMLDE